MQSTTKILIGIGSGIAAILGYRWAKSRSASAKVPATGPAVRPAEKPGTEKSIAWIQGHEDGLVDGNVDALGGLPLRTHPERLGRIIPTDPIQNANYINGYIAGYAETYAKAMAAMKTTTPIASESEPPIPFESPPETPAEEAPLAESMPATTTTTLTSAEGGPVPMGSGGTAMGAAFSSGVRSHWWAMMPRVTPAHLGMWTPPLRPGARTGVEWANRKFVNPYRG